MKAKWHCVDMPHGACKHFAHKHKLSLQVLVGWKQLWLLCVWHIVLLLDRAMEPTPLTPAIALGADGVGLPMPPYTENDNPLDGLACYIIGCKYKGNAWGLLLQHLRLKHKISFASLQGTFLHTKGKEEINLYKRVAHQAHKQKALCKLQNAVGKTEESKLEKKGCAQSPSTMYWTTAKPKLQQFRWLVYVEAYDVLG